MNQIFLEIFQYIYTIFIVVWNKWINIAAINCAQQDCKNFSINGTPTVRVFGPVWRTLRKIVRSQIPSVARCVVLM